MYVHRSNRAEALVDLLAQVVAQPLPSAIARECIVVQGRGMERWLSMQLARRLEVWANPDFPFPRRIIETIVASASGTDAQAGAAFAPEALLWSVANVLPAYIDRPEFAPVRTYLAGDMHATRRVQLAERIADVFDQYVVYRPAMVLAWERGVDTHWQAQLWRALVQQFGSTHIAARAESALRRLRGGPVRLSDVPTRISLFGLSSLPPVYVELLTALSQQVEMHLFILSPSQEYWADIRSQREAIRALRGGDDGFDRLEALHFDEGNPLLASLGRLGRDFQRVLEGLSDYQEGEADLYHDPGTGSVLTTLQSDLLHLRHRCDGNPDALPLPLPPEDQSISVHACHGALREVEVVHDQLRALFEGDRTLAPHDVVVMTPSIDTYAPFIDAVFGGRRGALESIPYRIADRRLRAIEDVVDAFSRLLDVLQSRMTATQVLDLLTNDAVRARFTIDAEDLDVVRTWIAESGIRWGVDGAHRAAAEQPARAENTWRFGLDRLLLGYAMPGHGRQLFGDVLPYDDIEGTATDVLGRVAEFCETLFSFHAALQAPRTIEAWRDDLIRLLEAMVASTDRTAYQAQRIRAALAMLAEHAQRAGFADAVELDTLRSRLDHELERNVPAHGFLAGGVSFCALVPMRSIPFRVICLLGMNDDNFPRTQRPLGFDLRAQRPRPGDRSARDDDRYLFLESLLSARQRLIITYTGQSVRDDRDLPPSVVVSELLDTVAESFRCSPHTSDVVGSGPTTSSAAGDAVHTQVVLRHPLQPFSPRYFQAGGDPRLFSYAQHAGDGARALVQDRVLSPPFLSQPLALPDDSARGVDLDELVRFFEHPTRAFLQRRLGLYLGQDIPAIPDREPIELNGLDCWKVGDALLARAVEGDDIAAALPAVRAAGVLPFGALGACAYQDISAEVVQIAQAARQSMIPPRHAPLLIDVDVDGTRITGVLRDLWSSGQMRYQYSKLGGRHELVVWIRHLVWHLADPRVAPHRSVLVGRPQGNNKPPGICFGEVHAAADHLRNLLRLYWLGQTMPLPLFPRASRQYVETLAKRNPAAALQAARKVFDPGTFAGAPNDGEDTYVAQAFANAYPFESPETIAQFADIARLVFVPFLAHREVWS